jgi:hypothetical protein
MKVGAGAGGPHPFRRLRWLALAWLGVYLPAYSLVYGPTNFLFLCNLGVILTCLGIWRGSALLLSSQAVGAMAICAAWWVDAGARLLSGRHLLGVTASCGTRGIRCSGLSLYPWPGRSCYWAPQCVDRAICSRARSPRW